MHAEQAKYSEQRKARGSERDGRRKVELKAEIERGSLARALRNLLYTDRSHHAQAHAANGDVHGSFETAVADVHRAAANDGLGDIDLDAGGCDGGRA